MLHLDPLAPRPPRLPSRRLDALPQLLFSAGVHATLVVLALLIEFTAAPGIGPPRPQSTSKQELPRLVFLAPQLPESGRGGGGGGNQQPGPIRKAQGVGPDPITLRTRKAPPPLIPDTTAAPHPMEPPAVVLDAKPLASGVFDQVGLPVGAMVSPSTGTGTGGGVGTGTGTGIGSGSGSGLGPGSGGGTGGGEYRPGGVVSPPRLIEQVRPRYTPEALRNKIQGTVILEVVVTSEGCPSRIRVVRSLDPGGLDKEAIATVAQWRFEPGRIGETAVDVLVTVMLDFTVR